MVGKNGEFRFSRKQEAYISECAAANTSKVELEGFV
jgi:hypothetical protein